jgi:chromosome partitioning protein
VSERGGNLVVTVTFLNQKGGVGKTSSCFHLSGTLARSGLRVLMVDDDPQASLTQGFLGPVGASRVHPGASVAALFEPGADPAPEALVMPTAFERIAIVPGSIALTEWNITPRDRWAGSQDGLGRFLAGVAGDYDVTLIDCPPNLHLCSWAALAASDFIVVPLQAEDFGSQGLAPVEESIEAVRARVNPKLRVAGYLLTMFDKRLGLHLTYEALLRELYGDSVFAAKVPRAKDYPEAVAARAPLALWKPKVAPAKALQAVADEMLTRVGLGADGVTERGAA